PVLRRASLAEYRLGDRARNRDPDRATRQPRGYPCRGLERRRAARRCPPHTARQPGRQLCIRRDTGAARDRADYRTRRMHGLPRRAARSLPRTWALTGEIERPSIRQVAIHKRPARDHALIRKYIAVIILICYRVHNLGKIESQRSERLIRTVVIYANTGRQADVVAAARAGQKRRIPQPATSAPRC